MILGVGWVYGVASTCCFKIIDHKRKLLIFYELQEYFGYMGEKVDFVNVTPQI